MTYLASKAIGFSEKTQNNGYYAVQGHRDRYQSKARMVLPISDTDILSRTVSGLSQLIVQI